MGSTCRLSINYAQRKLNCGGRESRSHMHFDTILVSLGITALYEYDFFLKF